MWWPNGPKGDVRDLLIDAKKDKKSDPDKILFEEQLIADLDDVISSGGYSDMVDLVQNREDGTSKRLRVLGEVYLKMRDKGYEGKILRK